MKGNSIFKHFGLGFLEMFPTWPDQLVSTISILRISAGSIDASDTL
jgi:hypothetical protein